MFEQKLEKFIAGANAAFNIYMRSNYPIVAENTNFCIRADGGRKFIRIVKEEVSNSTGKAIHRSAYAFIAAVDGETKALGKFKQGDVLKPASWKAPARHARGNIFADDNGLGKVGPYGPEYL